MVWLLGADEIAASEIPKDAFVVYQGHHGDKGAQLADVVLPGAAYTEKAGTYINTEGRVQVTRAATSLPGAARDDWKIIRAASEFLGVPLPYDDIEALRDRMEEISPVMRRYDIVEPTSVAALSKVQLADQNKGASTTGSPFKKVIEDFFFTDSISRRLVLVDDTWSTDLYTILTPSLAPPPWPVAQLPRPLATLRPTSWPPERCLPRPSTAQASD
jgi:NADH dehydrogenase (ubiquinone) Fe-S protein 1